MKRILLIEDEAAMRRILVDNLKYEGYAVLTANDGKSGLRRSLDEKPDVILLDVMLPDRSGFDLCRDLRSRGILTPIIMLTARSQEADRVLGLELGADDYIVKPFSIRELVARIHVQLRHQPKGPSSPPSFCFRNVTVDFRNQTLTRGIRRCKLSCREAELLQYLVMHQGEVVSREELLESVWGYREMPTTRTVDNFIAHLRRKLEACPARPHHLITVHGKGYKFLD